MSATKPNGQAHRLRVVIVGGSIAGLTLAHSLHHNNIDFVVLEARKEIAPQVGASIVVLPNGARILDQLGLYQDVASFTEPVLLGRTWNPNGTILYEADGPLLIQARYVAFQRLRTKSLTAVGLDTQRRSCSVVTC